MAEWKSADLSKLLPSEVTTILDIQKSPEHYTRGFFRFI